MKNNLRIAFFGTPDFAVASLKKMNESGFNIVAVFTSPDRPSGRGLQLQFSDVKNYALEHKLALYQPEKLKNSDFVKFYTELEIDIAIVVAFRMMPEVIWSAPKIGTINLHGSLLPQYRGAAPINWALINGEKETGVTTFFINSEIDKGDILFQSKCTIEKDDNFGSLYNKLKLLGAELIVNTINHIQRGEYKTVKQQFSPDDKPAPKIDKEISYIQDFSSCIQVENLIRGLIPVYKPYFIYNEKKYFIKAGYSELNNDSKPKDILYTDNKSFAKLVCGDGYYIITEIQMEGKKSIEIKDFFNGNKF